MITPSQQITFGVEFEILREINTQIKYFSLGIEVENNLRVSQSEDIEGLDDLVILDENLDQSDRFMNKINYANH